MGLILWKSELTNTQIFHYKNIDFEIGFYKCERGKYAAIHPLDWEEIEEVEREELASSFYNWLSNSYSIAEKHLKINVDSPVYWLD
jgi:hypothetical protein